MIRHLQNEADVARSLTWRRGRERQGMAARLAAHMPGPAVLEDTVRPVPKAIDTRTQGSLTTKALRTGPVLIPQNVPIILKLVERIASCTDPRR
ncbi:MAG TPA: hypothetical protein VF695_07725, partial [Sphingomonas sp.]